MKKAIFTMGINLKHRKMYEELCDIYLVEEKSKVEPHLKFRYGTKYGVIKQAGHIVLPFNYEEIAYVEAGKGYAVRQGEKWGYADVSGKFILPPRYESFIIPGMSLFAMGEVVPPKGPLQGEYDIINQKGTVVYSCRALKIWRHIAMQGSSVITAENAFMVKERTANGDLSYRLLVFYDGAGGLSTVSIALPETDTAINDVISEYALEKYIVYRR